MTTHVDYIDTITLLTLSWATGALKLGKTKAQIVNETTIQLGQQPPFMAATAADIEFRLDLLQGKGHIVVDESGRYGLTESGRDIMKQIRYALNQLSSLARTVDI